MKYVLYIALLLIGLSMMVFVIDHLFDKPIDKPTITIDSTSYWKTVELSARVDSFQKAPDKIRRVYIPKLDTLYRHDTVASQIAPNSGISANVFESGLTTFRGQDTIGIAVSFCEYPKPLFSWTTYWNNDRVQVVEKTKVITLPPAKPLFVHGPMIGVVWGVASKRIDVGIGYSITFNLGR